MKITLKLFATLSEYLPPRAASNTVEVDVADDATPDDLIEQFRVPRDLVHLVLLNGVYVQPADRAKPIMRSGDALAIWPPVAGG